MLTGHFSTAYPFMARTGHAGAVRRRLLLRVERTCRSSWQTSEFDCRLNRSPARLTKNEISKVMEFMEASIARNITLECIAALVGLSPRHFRRLFRASTGVGPNEMFTNMRLERAARDLRDSRKNVTEISFDCGFSQPQHLATAFRRKFGLTPTEFRRNVAS